ncbi:MAG: ribosomal protein S18-alanine N-acetyltransferase [candidate division KSB1 bacterium]|nr:ribosomal protein S18-alanine N-acetyltransferase [candidate division KSB1 bacterium]MDZ7293821.1 ribosomal protein S18-alanine N-acetyltransferase [candidate division KSB1 bacterium]MDZ7337855.1 ribosomal protein S18-alanine N-acetyltransferase [candidate division KSB1 bacterium]MDZ7377965.1 ribosomal protein S18-alanine N-acetyltransferase [candidate division KSB1 bacterium]MDZ7385435.1 ribosomal protein S18-alanine N-acetyltransferase [candidate division KSB1 bacterium]
MAHSLQGDKNPVSVAASFFPVEARTQDGRVMVVRHMEMADVPEVARIEGLCFSSPWSAQSFVSCLADREVVLSIVATINEQIAGYAVNWLVPPEIHIGNIAVAPDFRRLGVARQLLQTVLSYARTRGCTVAHLEVRVSNQAAITLYQSMGFRRVGIRRGYYQDNGEDALLMSANIGT